MRILIALLLTACGTDDPAPPPTCAELECIAIACGDLSPVGDAAPTACMCELADKTFTSCVAE